MTSIASHTTPQAWVGCLACYNGATLTRAWVPATEAADYTRCTIPGHVEWRVFDHEGLDIDGECSPTEAQRQAGLIKATAADGLPSTQPCAHGPPTPAPPPSNGTGRPATPSPTPTAASTKASGPTPKNSQTSETSCPKPDGRWGIDLARSRSRPIQRRPPDGRVYVFRTY